jgi:hypothetical protein
MRRTNAVPGPYPLKRIANRAAPGEAYTLIFHAGAVSVTRRVALLALLASALLFPAAALGADSVYWTNGIGGKISLARLDGSGGENLSTGTATVSSPIGTAIDPAAGRIYWANRNRGGSILFANVDGSGGGGALNTGTANVEASTFPSLLLSPHPQAAPSISGAALTGSLLSCSQGTWGADLPVSLLYRAPQSFAFQWSLDGTDIPGADQSSLTASSAGDYRCKVTAQNHAGASSQTSEPQHLSPASPPVKPTPPGPPTRPSPPAAFGSDTEVTVALLAGRIPAHGPVKVQVVNGNRFAIAGSLSAQTTKPVAHKRRVALSAKAFSIAAGASVTVKLALPTLLQKVLGAQHKLSLALNATVTDPADNHRTVKKTVAAKASAR